MKATDTSYRAQKTRRGKILQAAFGRIVQKRIQGGSLNSIVLKRVRTKGAVFHSLQGQKSFGYAVVREGILRVSRSNGPISRQFDRSNYDLKRIFAKAPKREDCQMAGLVHGCPLNNLAKDDVTIDEKFRQSPGERSISHARDHGGRVRPGIKARQSEKKNVLRPKWRVSGRSIAGGAGAWPAAKAPDEALRVATSHAFFDFIWTNLKPRDSCLCIISYRQSVQFNFQSPATTNQRETTNERKVNKHMRSNRHQHETTKDAAAQRKSKRSSRSKSFQDPTSSVERSKQFYNAWVGGFDDDAGPEKRH